MRVPLCRPLKGSPAQAASTSLTLLVSDCLAADLEAPATLLAAAGWLAAEAAAASAVVLVAPCCLSGDAPPTAAASLLASCWLSGDAAAAAMVALPLPLPLPCWRGAGNRWMQRRQRAASASVDQILNILKAATLLDTG